LKRKAEEGAQPRAAVRRILAHWQKDPDLAGVRDPAALEKLPKEEREAWKELWADIEAARKEAAEKK
jgi:serine/threonine-protein kinase